MTTFANSKLERLWALEDRLAEQRRRREVCSLRIEHHARLADVYRSHVSRHVAEQERYELLLESMTTTQGDQPDEQPAA